MRILRLHKLMSVSVFVIMQVCKLGAKMARLFHSDWIVAFFLLFLYLSTRLNVGHNFE